MKVEPSQAGRRLAAPRRGALVLWARAIGWKVEASGRLPWLRLCAFPALGLAGLCLLWGVLAWKIELGEQEARRAAIEHSQAVAFAYEQYIGRTVRQMDQMTRFVAFERERRGPNIDVGGLIEALVSPAPPVLVSLADADGMVYASSKPGWQPVSIADRPHFRAIKDHPDATIYIGQTVVGRISKQPSAQVTRRISNPDGSFGGTVIVSMEPRSFTAFYDTDRMGEEGLVGVAGTDGQFRAVREGARYGFGEPLWAAAKTQIAGAFVSSEKQSEDGVERAVAWRRVEGYPLVAVAGLSMAEELADFEKMKRIYERMGALGSLGLLAFSALGLALHVRIEARRRAISQTKEAYRTASEGTSDGFFIFSPILGASGEPEGFKLDDVNERGAQMMAKPRERLIGQTLDELAPPRLGEELLAVYQNVWDSGDTWRDPEIFCAESGAFCQRWISHQAARSGNGVAVTIRDITETKEHDERLQWVAEHDALTQLPNRHGLKPRLDKAIESARERGGKVALLFVDLDAFKMVNDTLGHAAGDRLLQIIGERMQTARGEGWVCRLGGDEFTIVIERDCSREELAETGRRLIASISQPMDLGGSLIRVGASVGAALYPDNARDGDELLKAADLAMYCAKEGGKGVVEIFEAGMAKKIQAKAELERELFAALERDEFFLAYQPKIELSTGVVRGLEALVRWQSPTRGVVPPLQFIELAEQSELILRIGEMVVEKACAQCAQWREEGYAPLPVSVNVSARQLQKGDIAQIIENSLRRHKVPAGQIEIELTESCMMENPDYAQTQLRRLKEIGVRILVDDFGTGYSSLSLLKRLEVDVLKMDRSFIRDLPNDAEGREIVRAIVSMAQALRLEVVAEGIETQEQSDFLRELGCGEGQGFHFGRPERPEALSAILPKL
jgi:diguanylate cyclase